MKILKQFEMHKPEGTFYDIATLYKWLGNVKFSSLKNKFSIEVKIVETKED